MDNMTLAADSIEQWEAHNAVHCHRFDLVSNSRCPRQGLTASHSCIGTGEFSMQNIAGPGFMGGARSLILRP